MSQQNLSSFVVVSILENLRKLAAKDEGRFPIFQIWYANASKFEVYQGVQEIKIDEKEGHFTITSSQRTETHSLYVVQGIRHRESHKRSKEAK